LKAEPICLVKNIYVSWKAKMPKTPKTALTMKGKTYMLLLLCTLCNGIPNIHYIYFCWHLSL